MRLALLLLFPAMLAAQPRKGTESPEWPRHVIATGFNSQAVVAADFTGDGRIDVIADAEGETRLFVAPDWKPIVVARGHDTIHAEVLDVEGDGDQDYIGAVYSPGPVFWLEQPAQPLTQPWPFRIVDDKVNGTHGVIRGDINGDGRLDLVGNSAQPKGEFPNSIVWWSVPKDPKTAAGWDRHVLADQDAPGLSHYMGIGDIDGDGKADVSAAGKDAPTGGNWFAWWKQPADGSTPWLKRTIAVNQLGATNILPEEFNGDGATDLFATRGHGKGVLWFEGPAPNFKLHEIDPELVGPHDLALGDVDGDGDIDAATCGKDSYVAAWYENDGRGRFTKRIVYDDQAVYDIRLVDMDGDLDLDILIAGQNSENVVWYENRVP